MALPILCRQSVVTPEPNKRAWSGEAGEDWSTGTCCSLCQAHTGILYGSTAGSVRQEQAPAAHLLRLTQQCCPVMGAVHRGFAQLLWGRSSCSSWQAQVAAVLRITGRQQFYAARPPGNAWHGHLWRASFAYQMDACLSPAEHRQMVCHASVPHYPGNV